MLQTQITILAGTSLGMCLQTVVRNIILKIVKHKSVDKSKLLAIR
jgi:hypothetical protein